MLNRPLQAAEGRIAVLIGATDVSALLEVTAATLSYTPRLPLPIGDSEVAVYLVSPAYQWREVARFPLRVAAPTPATPPAEQPPPAVAPPQPEENGQPPTALKRRWGFDKVEMTPSATIGIKSQSAEGHFPASLRPERIHFTDVTMQTALRTNLARGAFHLQSNFNLVGASFQKEALRFGELGNAAPQVDLAGYLIQTQYGRAGFSLGHIAFGANRHLIANFASRGLAITLPMGKRADFSLAAMNGTNIVGWSNFFGLNRRQHQIISGTLGIELDRERPGGRRLEASLVSGSRLPLNNFNQRAITDAEQNQGAGLRFIASDKTNRLRLEAGLARNRFTNPPDPLLNAPRPGQGIEVVPVREETRQARYLDLSYGLLRDLKLSEQKKLNLTFNLRHERVDPFFRSVAAFTQADRLQNQLELTGNLGEFTATVAHTRLNDNLDDIPSVLKTFTRRSNLVMGGPLGSLRKSAAQQARWWPRVAYIYDRVHQFGAGLPINASFPLDRVPDQISANHNFTAEWSWAKWRAGYRFNQSSQDNRQPGRERADFLHLVNGLTLGLTPHNAFELNFELSAEQAKNLELRRLDRTLRLGATTNWRMTSRTALSFNLSTIGAGDLARTASNRSIEGFAQWSYRFGYEQTRWKKFQGQFFIRYANRYARSRDRLFALNSLIKTWTLNAGVSFIY
jgi:hypothetical protein